MRIAYGWPTFGRVAGHTTSSPFSRSVSKPSIASVYRAFRVWPRWSARLFAASVRDSGTPLMLVEMSGHRACIMVADNSAMNPRLVLQLSFQHDQGLGG